MIDYQEWRLNDSLNSGRKGSFLNEKRKGKNEKRLRLRRRKDEIGQKGRRAEGRKGGRAERRKACPMPHA